MEISFSMNIFYYILLCFIFMLIFLTQNNMNISFSDENIPVALKLFILVVFTLLFPFVLLAAILLSSKKK